MSGAVAGILEIVVGAALEDTPFAAFGTLLIKLGVVELLGYAASLLQNPHRSPLIPIGAAYVGTLEIPAHIPRTPEEIEALYLRDAEAA